MFHHGGIEKTGEHSPVKHLSRCLTQECKPKNKGRKMETTIPFSGFYGSVHEDALDDALERLLHDDRGEILSARILNTLYNGVEWSDAYSQYAYEYCEAFAAEFEIKSLKFIELYRPKEYNFEIDRIFASISLEDVNRMYNETPGDVLKNHIRDRFTSCDGFISYYSNDLDDWNAKPLADWDANEIGTLVEAYVIAQRGELLGQLEEYDLFQNSSETAAEVITGNLTEEGERLLNIANYLYGRSIRTCKTLDSDSALSL